MPQQNNKQYLGDGVYIDYDGYSLILTTEDGINTQNKIYLEPEVYVNMLKYIEKLRQQQQGINKCTS